ncbi:glycosyltransferase [Mangrovimonas sp. CR14]|uniref:glycosyltransferase family 2 protein n=1 Tax=Mangrovimonas sp. CR14 TaxID=2706120 RepID=UPI001423E080|nr:glycosyltransferase family 2 protein [Mangrovimonas sp. CR14]NIK92521.1 glycosyltransferase [Mangrovimonas sp. CR14]
MNVLLSIITINYNNKTGLEKTMASVLHQTYNPIEYIIIDGGSTDGSVEVIKQHKDHLAYWVSEPDKGVYHAMNKGIKQAKGDYLLFLNSGDHFYSKTSLELFKPFLLQDENIDILYGHIEVIASKKFIKTYPNKLNFSYFYEDTLPHPASLIKKSCFNKMVYDETLKIVSDWKFFMLGICKYKFTYKPLNKVIATFYHNGVSSTSPELVQQEREQVLEETFFFRSKIEKLLKKIKTQLIKVQKF